MGLSADPEQLQGHARLDARSVAMHKAIARKLREAPDLLAIAHDNLQRWSASAGRSQPYIDAWKDILARPFEEVLALIQEDSEWMRAMRQSSPFAGVLSPKERWTIYDSFSIGTPDPGGRDHRG